ncbi:MAG: OmpP1/FadL family transporter [Planctomycetota bacterium]|jgi:long-chain fatty acid transport protein
MASLTTGCRFGVITLIALLGIPAAALAQGIAISGVGPVNRSMGGASVASPIDSAGAIHWNPATISGLGDSEVAFGFELILPSSELSSRIGAGALGGGIPPVELAGTDRSESGVAPVPTVAFVCQPDDSPWSYGLGLFGIGGFVGNYPASATNPVLTPQPPNGFGLGRISAQLDIFQMVPTVSYALTERISVGFAPTLTLARLTADPAVFAPLDNSDGDPFPTYPSAIGTRYHWGGGFQVGIYCTTQACWHFGASLKSTQWFESFRYKSADELGRPLDLEFSFDYPMIVSLGTAYSGIKDHVFACDLRYFDYGNTSGFESSSFDAATGAVEGLGWSSIVGFATGVQRRISDRLHLRMGYSYNQNPISDGETIVNVASALIIQHWLYLGGSYQMADGWELSLVYVHGFHNSISGPIRTPAGPIADTSVTSAASLDSIGAGITVRF